MSNTSPMYHDHGSHFTCVIDGRVERCVACDQPIEYAKYSNGRCGQPNHHCQPKYEGAKQAASTRHEVPIQRQQTYGKRLAEGVEMLRSVGDFDDE